MSQDAEDLRADARAALDAVAGQEPMLARGVVLAAPPQDAATGALGQAADSPAGPAPLEAAEDPREDVYEAPVRRNIQGNIVPGFNKDHQHFLFYRITQAAPAKRFLRDAAPSITSMDEALEFVRVHRAQRLRLGVAEPPGLEATWINIAFSGRGIEKLAGAASLEAFGEQSFRQGLAERSTYLGDPTDPAYPGHRSHWKVGGPHNEADILLIVASDTTEGLAGAVQRLRSSAYKYQMELIFEQRADTLPGNLRGHEHFGFKDGVSQPAIRGKASNQPGDFITPRFLVASPPIVDRHPRIFAKPGQPLIWPGQFLLGEPRQSPISPVAPAEGVKNFPHWAALGSYLVCRRLRQDVPAFWNFVAAAAPRVGIEPVRLAAALVGRWPSGAPVMRSPAADNPELAGDPFASNHFFFDDDTRVSSMRPVDGYPGDNFASAKADILGAFCPHFAHIRKMNPRDSATDLGPLFDTLTRLVLRRGIPFGPPAFGAGYSPELLAQERGLMFLCYGATIEDQFEFITRRWANSALHPNVAGHDPIIGQRDRRGDRKRHIDMPTASGPVRLELDGEWVTPTGGGYFLAPPIAALTGVLAA
jgi:Dyp-type peroxidase family